MLKNRLKNAFGLLFVEELRIFDRALLDSLGRMANVSLEGDVCNHAWFPLKFGVIGCRRAGDIALSYFLGSINSVGELVETIISRTNIANTNELAEAVESWRGASGGASLPDDPRRQKAWGIPIVKRNWNMMLREGYQLESDYWPHHRKRVGLAQCFAGFVAWNTTGLWEYLGCHCPQSGRWC